MIKTVFIASIILCLNLNAKDAPKIVQVEVISNDVHPSDLEGRINKFLIQKKIQRQDILDIKFLEDPKRILVIYETKYEEK
jgi:hypothetical protein